MATVKYLGKKENYGPLHLPWMTEPVKFDKNGLAKGLDDDLALAIEAADPILFKAGALKKDEKKPVADAGPETPQTGGIIQGPETPSYESPLGPIGVAVGTKKKK